jgi:triosephosphate isomerase
MQEIRRPLVAGNWKMNGTKSHAWDLVNKIVQVASSLETLDVVICPPFILIPQVAKQCEGTKFSAGGQNLDVHAEGAYTGEISGSMLVDHGCSFVIVGHSERRSLYGENDALVAEKAATAHACGLRPIVCVGETLEERENGQTVTVVERQMRAVIERTGMGVFPAGIVAYEPVWAIGTGQTATPQQAQEIHALIRDVLKQEDRNVAAQTRILYGGSVKPDNAHELFIEEDIDGGLIGGASLEAGDFLKICRMTKN